MSTPPHDSPKPSTLSTFTSTPIFTYRTAYPSLPQLEFTLSPTTSSNPLSPTWAQHDFDYLFPLSPTPPLTSAHYASSHSSTPPSSTPPSSSSPTAKSDADTDSIPPQPKKRVRERLSEDRLREKRQRQRESDVSRRQKEHDALARLQQVLTAGDVDSSAAVDEAADSDDKPTRMNKVAVLRESAVRIEQLQRLVAQLADACNQAAEDRSTNSLPTELSTSSLSAQLDHLPRFVSSSVQSYLKRVGLHSSLFIHSSACQLLLHARSGLIADVNDRFVAGSGWKRSELIGRRCFPPARLMQTNPQLVQNRNSPMMASNRPPVQSQSGRLVPQRQEPQYERTLQLAQQLWNGELESMDAVWRAQLRNGKVYERHIFCWVSEWEDVDCGNGVRRRQPLYILSIQNLAQVVCVEQ